MNKRGQFYLVATVIIVSIIAGFAVVSNYSFEKTPSKFYPIEQELRIESAKVLDYGIASGKNTNEVMKNFSRDYAINSDSDYSYYVFGKEDNLTLSGYNKLNTTTIQINVGLGEQAMNFTKNQFQAFNFSNTGENIKVIVNNVPYDFKLNKGQNFYFIVSKNVDGEKYVATNA